MHTLTAKQNQLFLAVDDDDNVVVAERDGSDNLVRPNISLAIEYKSPCTCVLFTAE